MQGTYYLSYAHFLWRKKKGPGVCRRSQERPCVVAYVHRLSCLVLQQARAFVVDRFLLTAIELQIVWVQFFLPHKCNTLQSEHKIRTDNDFQFPDLREDPAHNYEDQILAHHSAKLLFQVFETSVASSRSYMFSTQC